MPAADNERTREARLRKRKRKRTMIVSIDPTLILPMLPNFSWSCSTVIVSGRPLT